MSRSDGYDDGRYDDDRRHDLDDALKIRTRGTHVVKVKEWDHGRWKREDSDRNERYVLQDDLLVYKRGNRVRYYEDADGDGIWRRTDRTGASSLTADASSDPVISGGMPVSTSRSHDSWDGDDADRFELVNGEVINLIKTEREGYDGEISAFTDPNAHGIFTKINEVYASSI